MKEKFKIFIKNYSISIFSCAMMALLLGVWFTFANPTKTTIGDDVIVSGNVGIGTTSPQAKLHVNGNAIVSAPTINSHAATKEYVDSKTFWRTDPFFGDNGIYYNNGPVYVMDQQGFAMPDKGGVLTVSRENAPVSTSTLMGGHGLVIRDVGNLHNTGPSIAFGSSGGIDFDTMTPGAVITYERTGSWNMGNLHFWIKGTTAKEGSLSSAMTISNNSNVGIGTTNPTHGKVEIKTTASNVGGLTLWRGSGSTARSWINSSDAWLMQRATTDTSGIAIAANGNVGIGTTTPSATLHVNGTSSFSGVASFGSRVNFPGPGAHYIENGGCDGASVACHNIKMFGWFGMAFARYDGGIYGVYDFRSGDFWSHGSWRSLSDVNHKKDIRPLENVLEKIKNIRGVRYVMKDESVGSEERIGVIAQEIGKYFPEVVYKDDEGTSYVSYDLIGPILIEGIKEQQEMIDNQQEQINELRVEIESLKK